jgi:hypothetical protein
MVMTSTVFAGETSSSSDSDNQHILEFWGYHAYIGTETYSDTLLLRYYQPLEFDQWRGTLRLDTSNVSVYSHSPSESGIDHHGAGTTFLTAWGTIANFNQSWSSSAGGRVILPVALSNQWVAGPQIGASYKPPLGTQTWLADFSPLTRYMYGFDVQNNTGPGNPSPSPAVRRLELYPTVGIQLTPNTQIRFWDENGINYNAAAGSWFVPLDAMLTHRVNRHFLFAVGASKQVVETYQQYKWMVYSKVSFNF